MGDIIVRSGNLRGLVHSLASLALRSMKCNFPSALNRPLETNVLVAAFRSARHGDMMNATAPQHHTPQ